MSLLSARAPRLGLTLAPQAVADQTHAIPVVLDLRRHGVLEGRVVTVDALLTPRHMAQQMVEAGGDDVMPVKEHQPQFRADMATVVASAPLTGETRPVAHTVDDGHSRIAPRRLQTSDVLVGSRTWVLRLFVRWKKSPLAGVFGVTLTRI